MSYLYDPRRRRRTYRTRRRYDPGRSPFRNPRRGWHFKSKRGKWRYDPAYTFGKKRAKGILGKLNPFLTPGAFAVSFIQQATAGDMQYASGLQTPMGKAQYVIQKLVERITFGYVSPFPSIEGVTFSPPAKPSLNPMNCLNKWTGLGIGAIIYGLVPKAPMKGLVKKAGKGFLFGGILGGLLDEALPAHSQPMLQGLGRTQVGNPTYANPLPQNNLWR